MSNIINKLHSATPRLKRFLESRMYPPMVALIVAAGHISGLEFYFNIVLLLSVICVLLLCDSSLPLITPFVCFLYQIPLKHTPGIPTFSSYYFEGARLVILIALAFITLASMAYRLAVNIRARSGVRDPMLLPMAAMTFAFLLNGVFSPEWTPASLLLGFVETAAFVFVFYLFLFGLKNKSADEMLDSLCYATLCISFVLVAEMANMFISYDGIIEGGAIVKDKVNLGWGIWNPVGFSLTVLIPILVYGAMRMKYPAVYLAAAMATYISSLLTSSRNAVIFSTLAIAVSFLIGCFAGERKKLFRIATIVVILAIFTVGVLLYDRIAELFAKLIEQGISDNGRFVLWEKGIENFLSSPIFGTGFFGYGETEVFESASFIPTMAHNTAVQLISSMGTVGAIAYIYYRICSLKPLWKKPSIQMLMLYSPLFILMGMSIFDNFVFYVYTTFYAHIALAIAHSIDE